MNNNGPSSWPAIFNRGLVVVESSTIADNGKGALAGGGLFNSGVASVVDTVVVGHGLGTLADASAINNDRGTLTLLRSTIAHNSAIYAPAIRSSGTLFITNSTIVDNNSNWSPGGIVSSGFTVIVGSTIAGNQSDVALAAGIAGNIEIKNSILVGNYVHGPFGERESNCSVGTQSLGHNLVGISNDCPGLVEGINGDIVGVGLAAVLEIEAQPDCLGCPARPGIANNGGPTPTAAVLPGSPALDLVPEDACTGLDGKLLATDQRGIARPQGAGCDAGAFEFIHPQDSVFWMQQCREANSAEYDPAELALFLAVISEKSSAFPECAPANCSALEPDSPRSSWKAKASRELLAVWLNLASGRLTKGRPVDLHGLSSATSVGAAVAEIEATICDPNVSKQQLQRARDIGDRLNQGSY